MSVPLRCCLPNPMYMTPRSIRFILQAVALASSLCTASCIYEYDNCPDRLSLQIVNDWTAAPSATPGGMAYIFFPDDGAAEWRFDFPGNTAGSVSLPVGNYSFLSYNDDTANVVFSEDSGYDEYEAYTATTELLDAIPASERGSILPTGHDGRERVVRPPDMLWGCAYCSVKLHYGGVRYVATGISEPGEQPVFSPDFILTALQRPLTAHYTFRIEDIENLSGVSSMSAALGGMAGSLTLSSGEKGSYPSTLSLKAASLSPTVVGGDFYTFGIPPTPDVANILSLFVVIKDGRRFCYEFDVTDQVRTAPDPMEVLLTVRGLTIDKPDTGDGAGFDVSVDGWQTVTVNIRG